MKTPAKRVPTKKGESSSRGPATGALGRARRRRILEILTSVSSVEMLHF